MWPSFASKAALKKTPIVGSNLDAVQSLYVERSSSPEGLEKIIASMIER